MPTYTRRPNQGPNVLMRIGSGNWAAKDNHLTIGKGSGSKSDWISRVQFHIPEPDDWPANGRLVDARITVREDGGNQHNEWRGSSSRLWIKRLGEKPGYSIPDTNDGYYTQAGTGDKYPGSSVAGLGDAVEFNVSGTETRSIASLIEAMIPTRIKKRNGSPGGNALWGHFQLRSSDEGSNSRSMILDKEIVITIEIKTAVTPDPPLITQIIGAQDDSGPVTVGSTDGQTLEVVFAFRGAAGDTASKAELAFMGVGATDATPGAVVKTTGSVTPTAGGGTNVYRVKLTGITQGAEGRFRVRTTSQKGEQGDWTSLDDDDFHVRLSTIPGPPLDIVFQPFTEQPHILFSHNSPDSTETISGAGAVVTLLPQGTLAWSDDVDVGGSTRRADLTVPVTFADGQRVSYIVRTRNQDGVTGQYSAPRTQTLREPRGPTVTPGPGRVTSTRPTFTIADATFDGWRLRLLDPTDDSRVLYDSGGTAVTDQTSVNAQVPAGILTYGQAFRAVASTLPDGAVAYGLESFPQAYTVAALPTTVLSVPGSFNRRVDVEDVEWLRTVTDPDGGAVEAIDHEIRVADTPQGDGALVARWYDLTAEPLSTVPDGDVTFETAVDSRARARNDIPALAATTLNGALSVGATSATLTSGSGFVTGQDIVIASGTAGHTEVRQATIAGTAASWTEPLDHAHASGQAVNARSFGPWSPWLTITALEPPTVALITPADSSTITRPWATLTATVEANGTRSIASSVVTIYTEDGARLAALTDAGLVGAQLTVDIPAYLLEDATAYGWDVEATDSLGMTTLSGTFTFDTTFVEPTPITVLDATADPDTGTVVLTWDATTDTDLHHYEVAWIADDGSPVRIDGGPEEALDGKDAMVGTTLTHLGARLGVNDYWVAVHNGWRASEPVSASATLVSPDFRESALVDEEGDRTGLVATSATLGHAGTIERHHPPGGQPRQVTWGLEARSLSMGVHLVPSEDGELVSTLRGWARTGTPVWVKLAAPYVLDPLWATLQGFPAVPVTGGGMTIDLDWLELGDPVHSIIPPIPEPEPVPEPDILADADSYDFGDVLVPVEV